MQRMLTASGKEFSVDWCGRSTIDFALRFEAVGSSMSELLTTFTDAEETATLTHVFDGHETVYTGFTIFKGVDLKPSGTIVVALMEETI